MNPGGVRRRDEAAVACSEMESLRWITAGGLEADITPLSWGEPLLPLVESVTVMIDGAIVQMSWD